MITKRALTVVGTAIVLIASGGIHSALAGINGGGKPDTSKGKINRFGSIFVNGVRYSTDNALFLVDGEIGLESDLDVGQVVTVIGNTDADGKSGTAYLVIFENAVEGPVAAINGNELEVLGQRISVDGDTAFALDSDGSSLADLRTGDIVEISGHARSDGSIVATHVRTAQSYGEYDLTGIVAGVEAHSLRLTIGGLDVDFSAANLYGFDGGMPGVGERVRVFGSAVNGHGEFVATQIQNAPQPISTAAGDAAEIEGLVTRYASPWDFDVDGVRIAINWSTQFDGGWVFHVGPDTKLEVSGQFDSDGRLVADHIEFERASTTEIAGLVTDVRGDFVNVEGSWIRVDYETGFEDESQARERRFNTDSLRTGDFIRVRYYAEDGAAVATRLERLGASNNDDRNDDVEKEED